MEKVKISTEYIKLDQFLKWVAVVDNGVEAKQIILEGKVKVNGTEEFQRGKKLRPGDTVEIGKNLFEIE